jgi:hypothetical protein
VRGDSFLLRQAVVNLLDNAADFAPEGGAVEVTIARDGVSWHVTVADRGPGVPDFALDRAFERFYSLPRPGKPPGPGLVSSQRLRARWPENRNCEGGGAVALVGSGLTSRSPHTAATAGRTTPRHCLQHTPGAVCDDVQNPDGLRPDHVLPIALTMIVAMSRLQR